MSQAAGYRFDIVQLFWGAEYAATLCRFSLPTLLAAGNLPDWPYRDQTQLVLYCPLADYQRVCRQKVLWELSQLIEVIWVEIPEPMQLKQPWAANKYTLMSQFHMLAIKRAIGRQAGVILLSPDVILCEQSLAQTARFIAEGAEMVLIAAPSVETEAYIAQRSEQTVSCTREQGRELILSAGHSALSHAHLEARFFTNHPSHVFYRHQGRRLARYMHLHPLMILHPRPMWPEHYRHHPTIDGAYLTEYDDLRKSIKIDSRGEIVVFSLHPATDNRGDLLDSVLHKRLPLLYCFMRDLGHPFHHWLFGHEIELAVTEPQGPDVGAGLSALCLELVHFSLISYDACKQRNHAELASLTAQPLERARELAELVGDTDPVLLLGFFYLCKGLFEAGQSRAFGLVAQNCAVWLQDLGGLLDSHASKPALFLTRVRDDTFLLDGLGLDQTLPCILLLLPAPDALRMLESALIQLPTAQKACSQLVVVTKTASGTLVPQLASAGLAHWLCLDWSMGDDRLCALVDRSETVYAGSALPGFLPSLRAAMRGQFRGLTGIEA
ncbi:MAG: hypothetical protein ACAI44_27995 [Candidatus Sericytochromatia bacterium]